MEKKIWFKRKLYGWGWYPSTWEGWVVIAVWAIFFTLAMLNVDHEVFKNFLFIILSTVVLVVICYKKGEKPRWQWGKREDDSPVNR